MQLSSDAGDEDCGALSFFTYWRVAHVLMLFKVCIQVLKSTGTTSKFSKNANAKSYNKNLHSVT